MEPTRWIGSETVSALLGHDLDQNLSDGHDMRHMYLRLKGAAPRDCERQNIGHLNLSTRGPSGSSWTCRFDGGQASFQHLQGGFWRDFSVRNAADQLTMTQLMVLVIVYTTNVRCQAHEGCHDDFARNLDSTTAFWAANWNDFSNSQVENS